MIKLLFVFGTRPEAIKMAPLVNAAKKSSIFNCEVCITGQHREMLKHVLKLFSIKPDYDLNIMKQGQSLSDVTSTILAKIQSVYQVSKPDLIMVHGDTATTFAASLAAYYEKIDVGHVEAGLRTGNIYSPWPEEINRKLTASIARFHFSPTNSAKENLINEGIQSNRIVVTGNTVIDALFSVREMIENDLQLSNKLEFSFPAINFSKRIILVTGHRRENFGEGFESICHALSQLACDRPNMEIIYPVHLNPNVQIPVNRYLSKYQNIHLLKPLDYVHFVFLMLRSSIILTDSGGIQEEAPSLGKPVLVMRNTTERPEALSAGTVKLVGTNPTTILQSINQLLDDQIVYQKMSRASNPYGNGSASEVILSFIEENYEN